MKYDNVVSAFALLGVGAGAAAVVALLEKVMGYAVAAWGTTKTKRRKRRMLTVHSHPMILV